MAAIETNERASAKIRLPCRLVLGLVSKVNSVKVPVYSALLLSASSTGITGRTAFVFSCSTTDRFNLAVFFDKWVRTRQEPWERNDNEG